MTRFFFFFPFGVSRFFFFRFGVTRFLFRFGVTRFLFRFGVTRFFFFFRFGCDSVLLFLSFWCESVFLPSFWCESVPFFLRFGVTRNQQTNITLVLFSVCCIDIQYCRVPKNGLPKNGQAGISPKNKNDPGWKNELRTVHHTQRAFAVKTTSSAALLGLRNDSTSTV